MKTLKEELLQRPLPEDYQSKVKECNDLQQDLLEASMTTSYLRNQIKTQNPNGDAFEPRSINAVSVQTDVVDIVQIDAKLKCQDNVTAVAAITNAIPTAQTHTNNDNDTEKQVIVQPNVTKILSNSTNENSSTISDENIANNLNKNIACIRCDVAIQTEFTTNENPLIIQNHCIEQLLLNDASISSSSSTSSSTSSSNCGKLSINDDNIVIADDIEHLITKDDIKMLVDPDVQREEELIAFKENCAKLTENNLHLMTEINELKLKLDHGQSMSKIITYIAPLLAIICYLLISPYL